MIQEKDETASQVAMPKGTRNHQRQRILQGVRRELGEGDTQERLLIIEKTSYLHERKDSFEKGNIKRTFPVN